MGSTLALGLGLGLGALSAGVNYAGQQSAIKQQQEELNYQAAVAANMAKQAVYESEVNIKNSQAMLQQAEIERQKGEIDLANLHKEKEATRRVYNTVLGENRSLLAANNVDLTTGSAWDALMGNAQYFAEDMATNIYQKLLATWQANQSANQAKFQSDMFQSSGENLKGQSKYYDASSSYYKQVSSSLKPSLLSALMTGAMTGLSTYATAGGAFGLGSLGSKTLASGGNSGAINGTFAFSHLMP